MNWQQKPQHYAELETLSCGLFQFNKNILDNLTLSTNRLSLSFIELFKHRSSLCHRELLFCKAKTTLKALKVRCVIAFSFD